MTQRNHDDPDPADLGRMAEHFEALSDPVHTKNSFFRGALFATAVMVPLYAVVAAVVWFLT